MDTPEILDAEGIPLWKRLHEIEVQIANEFQRRGAPKDSINGKEVAIAVGLIKIRRALGQPALNR